MTINSANRWSSVLVELPALTFLLEVTGVEQRRDRTAASQPEAFLLEVTGFEQRRDRTAASQPEVSAPPLRTKLQPTGEPGETCDPVSVGPGEY